MEAGASQAEIATDSIVAIPQAPSQQPLTTHAETPTADATLPAAFTEPPPDSVDISFFSLFKLFLYFGLNAWGGPVVQIAMIKEELVVQRKWITPTRFNRVLSVYQVLPGPEATELCCYFGMVARGRVGAVLAGLGFVLPGFVFMLAFSAIYDAYGLKSKHFAACFEGLKPVVVALVLRALHRLSEHAFQDPKTHHWDMTLIMLGWVSAVWWALRINFFLILIYCGACGRCWIRVVRSLTLLIDDVIVLTVHSVVQA